ncbi:MAG: GntR family transcriptional regulator [Candidatus Rokuibacteriota bacterium]
MPETDPKSASLRDEAYEVLKTRIISMGLQPSVRLDQARLERELGLGRTPIREALLRLSAENLVEVNHNHGFTVKPLTLKDASDLFEALLTMERFSARLAAQHITPAELRALETGYGRIQAAIEREDYLRITLANSLLHRQIAAASHNRFVQMFLETLHDQAQRLAYISFSRPLGRRTLKENFQRAQHDHRQIIQCLSKRDAEGVDEIMTAHTLAFRSRIQAFLESQPAEEFRWKLAGPFASARTPSGEASKRRRGPTLRATTQLDHDEFALS